MDEDMGGTFINCSLLDAPAPACDGSVTGDPHLRILTAFSVAGMGRV
jgi:hypothetical protein